MRRAAWRSRLRSATTPSRRGAKGKQQVTVTCNKPFAESPVLTVSFSCDGTAYKFPITFPVVGCTFCTPAELDADTFQQRWSNPKLQEKEAKETFRAAEDKGIETLETVLPTLGFNIVEDVDESANKVYAAGTFVTSKIAAQWQAHDGQRALPVRVGQGQARLPPDCARLQRDGRHCLRGASEGPACLSLFATGFVSHLIFVGGDPRG